MHALEKLARWENSQGLDLLHMQMKLSAVKIVLIISIDVFVGSKIDFRFP